MVAVREGGVTVIPEVLYVDGWGGVLYALGGVQDALFVSFQVL